MYKQIKPLPEVGKMVVESKPQSSILQDVLLEGGKPLTGSHSYMAWNKKGIWAYTFEFDFKKCENPLHLFTDYFEPIK